MANQIVSVHAVIYGMGIYAIMLPSSGFSVAHFYVIEKICSVVYRFRRHILYDLITMTDTL